MLGFTGQREWVYPEAVKGKWQQVRRVVAVLLHVVLFLLVVPWLRWGGAGRSFLASTSRPGGSTILGRDVHGVSDGVLLHARSRLLAAFTLFFFTALFGRRVVRLRLPAERVFLDGWVAATSSAGSRVTARPAASSATPSPLDLRPSVAQEGRKVGGLRGHVAGARR
jgi:hypothetical protein